VSHPSGATISREPAPGGALEEAIRGGGADPVGVVAQVPRDARGAPPATLAIPAAPAERAVAGPARPARRPVLHVKPAPAVALDVGQERRRHLGDR
jgi:hypothetical protein